MGSLFITILSSLLINHGPYYATRVGEARHPGPWTSDTHGIWQQQQQQQQQQQPNNDNDVHHTGLGHALQPLQPRQGGSSSSNSNVDNEVLAGSVPNSTSPLDDFFATAYTD